MLIPPNRPFYTVAVCPLDRNKILRLLGRWEVIIFYGFIEYLDVMNNSRETRFCYIGRFSALSTVPPTCGADGPPAYTRYT